MRMRDSVFDAVMASVRRQGPALLLFSFLANLLLLASSIYMLQVFDRVLSSGSIDTLMWLTVIAVGAIIAYGLIEQARSRLLSRIGLWLDNELSPPVLRRSMRARLSGVPSEAGLGDVADLRGFIGGDAVTAFLDAPWVPVFIAVIWLIHPALGMIAVGGAVLLFISAIVNDLLTRRGAQQSGAAVRRNHQAAQQFVENAETVSALGMTQAMLARWQERQRQAQARGIAASDVTAILFNASRSLRLALQVAILGTGAFFVLAGEITAGGMIAASIILSRALAPVERSINAWRKFTAARAAHRNLAELFRETGDDVERLRLPRPAGHLAVESLRYLPRGATRPILSGVEFRLEPGQTCGIIGPSGAGKSTLCRLLAGAWTPSYGHVRLDGADIATWDDDDLGRHVGYLPQQVELFAGTVAENIARMSQADDDAIVAAAKLAGVHDMVLRLPDGYDSDVGVHGHKLSGGQRQRLGLARALFGDPVLIVLDEPASNLDGEGDEALYRALTALKEQGRTILIVAHQPSTLRTADKILMLKDGMQANFGDRDEVLKALMAGRRAPTPARAAAAVPMPPLNAIASPAKASPAKE